MSLGVLRDLPPLDVFSRRFWEASLGFARWLASRRRGQRAVESMLQSGLPPSLREPLEFLLGAPLRPEDRERRRRIETFRRTLLDRRGESVETWSTLSTSSAEEGGIALRSVSLQHVAAVGSILPYWGSFLLLCARSIGARSIIELGACAGISSCYLAAAGEPRLITVEGSEALSRLAARHLGQVSSNARVLNQSFDEALNEVLPGLSGPLDLAFIDGEHTGKALRHYVERLVPHIREGGIILLDDIHWTEDMEDAWIAVAASEGNQFSVDLGRLGMCIRGGPQTKPLVLDFSAFTTFWRRGSP